MLKRILLLLLSQIALHLWLLIIMFRIFRLNCLGLALILLLSREQLLLPVLICFSLLLFLQNLNFLQKLRFLISLDRTVRCIGLFLLRACVSCESLVGRVLSLNAFDEVVERLLCVYLGLVLLDGLLTQEGIVTFTVLSLSF